MRIQKVLFVVFALTATMIGLYPVIYLLINREFGLLGLKSAELLSNMLWNIGFYMHIGLGGAALLTGWLQFSAGLRRRKPGWHRNIGKIYVISVLLSALASVYIGFFSTGGYIAASGFISLGIIWFYTTLKAYIYIRKKNIIAHEAMMTYSYAACFAAVTLRVWLPALTAVFDDFYPAYKIVAWLCWVPNLVVAHYIIKRKSRNVKITMS